MAEPDEALQTSGLLRVRRPAGDVLLEVAYGELEPGMKVAKLRQMVGGSLHKSLEEVALLCATAALNDEELVHSLFESETLVEVVAIVQDLPRYDPDAPMEEQIQVLRKMIMSLSEKVHQQAAMHLRKLLSIQHAPPIDAVIEAGIVPRLLELSLEPRPALQLEAAWALTNIASGSNTQTQAVVDAGMVDAFRRVLEGMPEEKVTEQVVWGLGNIAGDSPKNRDVCLRAGVLPVIVRAVEASTQIGLIRNSVWAISNMHRGKPQPDLQQLLPALPLLTKLLYGSRDEEALTDVCWALAYLSDGPNVRIQTLLDSGAIPKLVELLSHGAANIVTPSVRAIGNVATGEEAQTQVLLDHGALLQLWTLLSHRKATIVKETVWTLSNILAGSAAQIQAVFDHPGIIQWLVLQMRQISNRGYDVRREMMYAVANAATKGTKEQAQFLVEIGAVPSLMDFLQVANNNETQNDILEALSTLLAACTKGQRDSGNLVPDDQAWAHLLAMRDEGNAAAAAVVAALDPGDGAEPPPAPTAHEDPEGTTTM